MHTMKRYLAAAVTIALASAAHAAGGGPVKAGPAGIPFSCSDGRSMRVVYGGEGPKAKAKLLFDGSAAYEMEPAPTIMDRRYTAASEAGRQLAWSTNGIEGSLLETGADGADREVARCQRVGWGAQAAHSDSHSDDHGEAEDHGH